MWYCTVHAIVCVAEGAKQYVTGKTGSRLHSAATDAMSEGRRQVDVDFVILVLS